MTKIIKSINHGRIYLDGEKNEEVLKFKIKHLYYINKNIKFSSNFKHSCFHFCIKYKKSSFNSIERL
jgi:hypothetical protein